MPTLYLASHNRHKALEMQQILGSNWTILSCQDIDPGLAWDENGDSFESNARIKAEVLRGDRLVLADDSGLEVDALNGAPGIYSARYAGEGASDQQNLLKLLSAMAGIPDNKRKARFVCVLCLLDGHRGEAIYFKGSGEGKLIHSPSGGGGFGYDPIFVPDGYSQTFAELGESVKNRISHRAKAMAQLKDFLERKI